MRFPISAPLAVTLVTLASKYFEILRLKFICVTVLIFLDHVTSSITWSFISRYVVSYIGGLLIHFYQGTAIEIHVFACKGPITPMSSQAALLQCKRTCSTLRMRCVAWSGCRGSQITTYLKFHCSPMCNISENTLRGCAKSQTYGLYFWTAGQRIDPSRGSTFVWRVTSTDTCCDKVSVMSYTNWRTAQPDYYNDNEACMHILSGNSYTWNDDNCSSAMCSVCEIDMWTNMQTKCDASQQYFEECLLEHFV